VRVHREPGLADRVVGEEVQVPGAVGLLAGRACAEVVLQAVRVLHAEPFPAHRAVELPGVGVEEPGVGSSRVVVVNAADVEVEVGAADVLLEPGVEVPFETRAVVRPEVLEPAHVRRPGPGIEAARVPVVETALDRRVLGRLRDAAEDVLAEQAHVGGDRVRRVLREHRCGRCGDCRSRRGEQKLLHWMPPSGK
jgi:hypothetical protein